MGLVYLYATVKDVGGHTNVLQNGVNLGSNASVQHHRYIGSWHGLIPCCTINLC